MQQIVAYFRYVVPAAAMIIVAVYFFLMRTKRLRREIGWGLLAALGVLAVSSLVHFTLFFWTSPNPDYLNYYEFFHYYIGAKYAPEVGYSNMYNAAVVAEAELGEKIPTKTLRNLANHRTATVAQILGDKDKYKGLFTPDRWTDFKKDIRFLRKHVSAKLWAQMLNDKGYNGTPVWTVPGGILSNMFATDNSPGMHFIAMLDLFLLAAAALCVWRAFSLRTALLFLTFFGAHYLISEHYTLRAAFLRLDWVMCLVMAVCMLKTGHYKTAGALTAYAGLARMFPFVFAFGMGARALWGFLEAWKDARRVPDDSQPRPGLKTAFLESCKANTKYFAYFISFGVSAILLLSISIAYAGGLGSWKEFVSKIGLHDSEISAWRIGFKYVFLMSYNGNAFWGQDLGQFYINHRYLYHGIQLAILLISFFAVRTLKDYEALAYGYVAAYFLVAPTYYYQVMLIIPFLFFAARIKRPERMVGLLVMFGTSMIAFACYTHWNRGYKLSFTISVLLGAFSIYLIVCAFLTPGRKAAADPNSRDDSASPELESPPSPKMRKRKRSRR